MSVFLRPFIALSTIGLAVALSTTAVASADPIGDIAVSPLSTTAAGVGSTTGSAAVTIAIPSLLVAFIYDQAVTSGVIPGRPVTIPDLPR